MELPGRADFSSRMTLTGNAALPSKTLNLLERYKKYHVILKTRMLNYSCPPRRKPAQMRLEAEPGAGLFQQKDQKTVVTPRTTLRSEVTAALRSPSLSSDPGLERSGLITASNVLSAHH